MDIEAVQTSYARWAPVYDKTFGVITDAGRRRAVEYINAHPGKLLEVGVGTGLSLPHYGAGLQVTGIDFSEKMLQKAREKVRSHNLCQVAALRQMDARSLDFPDDHFDTIAAMHVLSVVPEPEKVMAEIARVCAPGGKVVIVNHFERQRGALAFLERLSAPFADFMGWHSDFPIETVLRRPELSVVHRKSFPPMGLMTFLVMEKKRPVPLSEAVAQ